jgi:hypothetical protein
MPREKADPFALPDELPAEGGFYVTNGSNAVGPVALELLRLGIASGKVPEDGFVRHESWKVWRPIAELKARLLAGGSDDDETPASERISQMSPESALAEASDLQTAWLLLLGAAVHFTRASAGIVHAATDAGAVVVCSHGPRSKELEGVRIGLLDPVLLAAAGGRVVLAEPSPGDAGHAMLARLAKLGATPTPDAAFMLPIRPGDRLRGVLELGRHGGFSVRDLERADALVRALEARFEAAHWES